MIGNAVKVMRIATGEEDVFPADDKDKAAPCQKPIRHASHDDV